MLECCRQLLFFYRKNVMSQVMSAMVDYLITKYQLIMTCVRCGGPGVCLLWLIWKFCCFASIQWRDWFLLSDEGSGFWTWTNSERSFKIRAKLKWCRKSETDERSFSKVDVWNLRGDVEIEDVVDLVQDEHDDWIGLDLNLKYCVTIWEEDVNKMSVWKTVESQFRKS